MRIKNGVTNYYIYGVGLLYEVTETATATNTFTYHFDYRGSTIALTDGSGNVTDRMEYSAYATLTYRIGESLISGEPGHVFNALNNNGSIQFINFQSGGSGLNNFNNFQNFRFLLTHPGTP